MMITEESAVQFEFLVSDLLEVMFEKAAHRHLSGQKVIDKRYTCTLSSTDEFYNYIIKAGTLVTVHRPAFLDVGCGVGHKILLAREMGYDAYGLEIVNGYIKEGRKLFQLFDVDKTRECFIEGDALKYNHYNLFSVLFCVQLFVDDELQKQLQDRIVSQAESGTVIIFPNGVDVEKHQSLRKIEDYPIYIKK